MNPAQRGIEPQSKNGKQVKIVLSVGTHYEGNVNNFIYLKEKCLKMIFKRKCSVIDLGMTIYGRHVVIEA
jgi:hypothetical protein